MLRNLKPLDNWTICDTRQLVRIKIPVDRRKIPTQFQVMNIKLHHTLHKVHQVQCKEVRKKGC